MVDRSRIACWINRWRGDTWTSCHPGARGRDWLQSWRCYRVISCDSLRSWYDQCEHETSYIGRQAGGQARSASSKTGCWWIHCKTRGWTREAWRGTNRWAYPDINMLAFWIDTLVLQNRIWQEGMLPFSCAGIQYISSSQGFVVDARLSHFAMGYQMALKVAKGLLWAKSFHCVHRFLRIRP